MLEIQLEKAQDVEMLMHVQTWTPQSKLHWIM